MNSKEPQKTLKDQRIPRNLKELYQISVRRVLRIWFRWFADFSWLNFAIWIINLIKKRTQGVSDRILITEKKYYWRRCRIKTSKNSPLSPTRLPRWRTLAASFQPSWPVHSQSKRPKCSSRPSRRLLRQTKRKQGGPDQLQWLWRKIQNSRIKKGRATTKLSRACAMTSTSLPSSLPSPNRRSARLTRWSVSTSCARSRSERGRSSTRRRKASLPLWRCSSFQRTLHPLRRQKRLLWSNRAKRTTQARSVLSNFHLPNFSTSRANNSVARHRAPATTPALQARAPSSRQVSPRHSLVKKRWSARKNSGGPWWSSMRKPAGKTSEDSAKFAWKCSGRWAMWRITCARTTRWSPSLAPTARRPFRSRAIATATRNVASVRMPRRSHRSEASEILASFCRRCRKFDNTKGVDKRRDATEKHRRNLSDVYRLKKILLACCF